MVKQLNNLTWIEFWKDATCEKSSFEELLKNSHFYGVEPVLVDVYGFLEHIEVVKGNLGIQPGDSVFEIGCGGGLILYSFYRDGYVVGGSELSPSYLEAAQHLMPEGRFETGDALSVQKSPSYDFVLSCATANYFPSLSYFKDFIEIALQKANKGVYIAQLNDVDKKESYYRINEESESTQDWNQFMEDYQTEKARKHNQFYENADRLFFYREMFMDFQRQYDLTVRILPQAIPNKAREYRFDVALIKH